jgi:3-phosphoshikimate 1-carboxyvinyltransferase
VASRRFEPAGPLEGRLRAAPDKSISHRAALIAAMSDGACEIGGYLDAADTRSTLEAVAALGAGVETGSGSDGGLAIRIEGVGIAGPRAGSELDAGNAGTLIRLICGWLAGRPGASFSIDGDESIRRRPMDRVAEPLRRMGATIEAADGDRPPLRITGADLAAIDYTLPVASAQVKSCVLLAGIQASGTTIVREPELTRDHTERMLVASGVPLRSEPRTALPTAPAPALISVSGVQGLQLPSMRVPGDLSSAAFHLAAAALVPGSRVTVEGVGLNPTRVGFLGILNRMGARIEVEETGFEAGEPIGRITARAGGLEATRVGGAEVPLAIDELPLVALLGCFAEGETVVTGAEELRHKESDRIASVVDGLAGLGASIEALEDGFLVEGTGALRGGTIDAAGDHRIAMLGAVAGLASQSGVEVRGMEAAAISYPAFEADLGSLTSSRLP